MTGIAEILYNLEMNNDHNKAKGRNYIFARGSQINALDRGCSGRFEPESS